MELFKGLLSNKPDALDVKMIEEVAVGNVRNQTAAYSIRAAALAAGLPEKAPTLVVSRFCSSGLMAIRSVANQIQTGEINCGLAAGVESMSFHVPSPTNFSTRVENANGPANDCKMPMGWTSENVAGDFNISREKMDAFAARSHARAAAAQEAKKFEAEIFPIQAVHSRQLSADQSSFTTRSNDTKTVSQDDGIRRDTTSKRLGSLKPAFPQWQPSQTTGGNASQLTDGGAGVIMMRRSMADRLKIKPIAKYVATSVSGLAPRVMGIGPTLAISQVLTKTGLRMSDVDLVEINEAFASMAVYCEEKLRLDPEKYNVNGGAIALGHPLGATGARLVVTALTELQRREQHVAVVSMCIGLGMGAASVFIREGSCSQA